VESKLTVSFIEFLNAIPLGWGFLYGTDKDKFKVLFDVPSECARHLARSEADVGLIPVIEYQRIPGLQVIPDISISSRRKVRSVLFASRKPIDRIETVALDCSSRTSVVLLKILMAEFYGQKSILYAERRPEPSSMLNECDAALLIGHNAIKASLNGLWVYDLAEEWHRFTGLPFVFAFWAVREGVDMSAWKDIFVRSRDEGLKSLLEISKMYASELSLSPEEIHSYLYHNLHYSMNENNLAGLNHFYELAYKIGVIEKPHPLQFLQD